MATEVYLGKAVGRGGMANFIEGDLGDTPIGFTLELTGYTSEQEVDRLTQILKTNGQEALLQALDTENLGYFRLNGQPQRPVILAQQSHDESSRTITVLCKRWLNTFDEGFEERAADFPFAFIEISSDRNGNGEGSMFTAASVKFDKPAASIIDVTCFAAQVEFPTGSATRLGVEDYANDRDWLKDVRLDEARLVQVHR